MDKKKYVAYVGTYTHGNSVGIHLFDLDVENGTMKERKVIPINNPSYIKMSHNGKFLYSIADEGVRSFTVQPDGDLVPLNCASIEGMRWWRNGNHSAWKPSESPQIPGSFRFRRTCRP